MTAEESGACYLEGQDCDDTISDDLIIEPLNLKHPEQHEDEDSTAFPTTPPIYRLMVNDEEWRNVNKSPKTPSHKLRQQLLRLSKHQCTV